MIGITYSIIMNLHICTHDKFLSSFIRTRARFASESVNQYYVVSNRTNDLCDFSHQAVKYVSLTELKQKISFYGDKECEQVIFHSLPSHFRKHLLHQIPQNIPVTWIFFGYEYYHRRDVLVEYLSPQTRNYYKSGSNANLIRIQCLRLLDYIKSERKRFKNDLKRITRFAHWNHDEYELIKSRLGLYEMEFVPFSMGSPIHLVVPDCSNNYLLLGHSGALTVNHLDGIQKVDHQLLERYDRVIIPVSYGASKTYRAKVDKVARDKLGDKAIIIDKFIERTS